MEQRDWAGYKELLRRLEKIYGKWTNVEIVPELLRYLTEEIHPDKLDACYRAILKSHSVAKGAPDIAAVELAVKRAEERRENLRAPDHIMNWSSSPVLKAPPTDDERGNQISMKAQAKAIGINVEVEGWMTSFIMHEVERKARENGRMALPGDKRAR